jgi:hypothetical protein
VAESHQLTSTVVNTTDGPGQVGHRRPASGRPQRRDGPPEGPAATGTPSAGTVTGCSSFRYADCCDIPCLFWFVFLLFLAISSVYYMRHLPKHVADFHTLLIRTEFFIVLSILFIVLFYTFVIYFRFF